MTGFLDTEIAPAIKPTPQNKGQHVDTKSQLNGWDLLYVKLIMDTYAHVGCHGRCVYLIYIRHESSRSMSSPELLKIKGDVKDHLRM